VTSASLRNTSARTVKADAVVIGFIGDGDSFTPAPGAPQAQSLIEAWGGELAETLRDVGASAKPGEVCKLPSAGAIKAPLLVVAGLGMDEDVTPETLRKASGAAARALGGKRTVAIALPCTTDEQVQAVVEGSLMGAYAYDRYLSKKQEPVAEVVVLTEQARSKSAKAAAEEAICVAEAVNYTRDLINTPPNDLYPESFADEVAQRGKKSTVKVSVTAEKQLEARGYGGILGVGKGSARSPRLVTLSYQPSRPVAHLAFVGKGITFDSGGLSLKPGSAMVTMKCDMSGAAAVAAATFAIAELGLPVRVSSYLCLAENMPAGNATRPGDVLTMYGGKTVEVLNTDAEGRLVLADGLVTANAVEPDLIVDVATLTGACVVALGNRVAGVFSNDADLLQEVPKLAASAGELMWPMPIPDEMKDKLRTTKIADLSQHNPDLWGGALFAAAFLREFVGEGIPWAHLDIAGPAFNSEAPHGYTPKGGTGAAVRTLIALARSRSRAA
jgi:leucyl aminopeptidase